MIVTPTRLLSALVLACLVGVTLPLRTAAALDPSIGRGGGAPTIETTTALREAAEADSSLDESEQAKVLQLYDLALRSLRAVARLRAEAARVRERANSASARNVQELAATPEADPQARGVSPERIAQLSDEALATRVEQAQRALDAAIEEFRTLRQDFRERALAPLEPSGQTVDALDAAAGQASGGPETSVVLAQRVLARARADLRVDETEAVQRQRKSQERSPWRRTRR